MARYLDVVVVQERLSTGKPVFVAHCTTLGITSQGTTRQDAERQLRDAVDGYLSECS
jgi:predicted RNase H-like HicB family nuclease